MGLDKSIEIAKQFTKFMDHIREVAKRDCWPDKDDFCPVEFSGGNFDDAYDGGKEAGEIIFARHLLTLIGEK